jgi:hypothetical protein
MVPPKDMRKSGLEVSELNTSNPKGGVSPSPVSGAPSLDDEQKKKFWMDVADTSLGAATGFLLTLGIFAALDAVDKEERRQKSK